MLEFGQVQPRVRTLQLDWLRDIPTSMAVSAAGDRIAFGTKAGRAAVWSQARPKELTFLGETMGGGVNAVSFADADRWLFVGTPDGYLSAWRMSEPWRPPLRLRGHEGMFADLHSIKEPSALLSVPLNGDARIWRLDPAAAEPWAPDIARHQRLLWPPKIHAMDVSPNGESVLVAGDHGLLQVWSLKHPSKSPIVLSLGGPTVHVMAASFSADGRWLTAASTSGEVVIWELSAPVPRKVARLETQGLSMAWAIRPHPKGGWVAAMRDGRVSRWAPEQPKVDAVLTCHSDLIRGLALDAKRGMLNTASDDGRVCEGREVDWTKWSALSLPGQTDNAAGSVTLSEDGRWMALGRIRGVSLFDRLAVPAREVTLEASGFIASGIAFSPDGSKLAAGGNDGLLRVWATSKPEAPPSLIAAHGQAIRQVAFSPDGQLLLTGGFDASVKVWSGTAEGLVAKACRLLEDAGALRELPDKQAAPLWTRACDLPHRRANGR